MKHFECFFFFVFVFSDAINTCRNCRNRLPDNNLLVWTSSLCRVGQDYQYCILSRSGGLPQQVCLRGQQVWSRWTHKGTCTYEWDPIKRVHNDDVVWSCLIPRPHGVRKKWPGYEVTMICSLVPRPSITTNVVEGLVFLYNVYYNITHSASFLTQVVALETAGTGVTCNAVCPGWVLTPCELTLCEPRVGPHSVWVNDLWAQGGSSLCVS